MNPTDEQLRAAKDCIRAALRQIAEGKNEDVIRQSFTSYLRSMFPGMPQWVEKHIEGGEAAVKIEKAGKVHTRFVDNLVDLTSIEYESNLTVQAKFKTGLGQVKEHCASFLNAGHDPDLVVGVLSDTIRWRAYKIRSARPTASGRYGPDDIELDELEAVDLSAADDTAAKTLIGFLGRNLGRLEARPLNASSIASDLGFESRFCGDHIGPLRNLIASAFSTKAEYARLITTLWSRFVGVVRDKAIPTAFDQEEYADEVYILTLAKLACANVIERRALLSDDDELRAILRGDYFRDKGLVNLVEYDYFGWLHEPPFLNDLLPIARDLQDDLRAYNFSKAPSEDLFGEMMSQLAKRSQRLLLGQEWTPSWLARLVVGRVMSSLPEGELPQLVDMCCGSGTMVVEAVRLAKERIAAVEPDALQERKLHLLSQSITGFDIDPLAVMLAKTSWVLAARDWLEPFGAFKLTIPVYNADSLFAITPLSSAIEDERGAEFYRLLIADETVKLPGFLISPDFQGAFDALLDVGYEIAMSSGEGLSGDEAMSMAAQRALSNATAEVTEDEQAAAEVFLREFVLLVDKLNKEGRNGIWVFILRNSYRPGLVAGQFNGLVSNPPWLALSKLADNPYQLVLKTKAEQFGITPPGPAFLHVELATIFLLHAVDRYLRDSASVGCIAPDSVLNGYHHDPFRTATYGTAADPVSFALNEVWRVQEGTFKNKAIVIFGSKEDPEPGQPNPIPGHLAQGTGLTPLTFYRNVQGKRTAWSEQNLGAGRGGFFDPAAFHQGADIMPRTLFFHDLSPAPAAGGRRQWSVQPIDVSSSPLAFVVADAKKCKDFKLRPCVLRDAVVFDVLTSNLLTPLDITPPLKAVLPIRKGIGGVWEPLSPADVAAMGATDAFRQVSRALGSSVGLADLWKLLDTRRKLSQQVIMPGDGYLVFTGTSGEKVCSAFIPVNQVNTGKLIIDQTLNWARVETEDEAIYLTGLFNSEAINMVIGNFQPEGAFGKRHIHSLPFGVTPPFDLTQAAHEDVVEATKRLLADYEAAKARDPELQRALDPNWSTLARRRLVVTAKLKALPSYDQYAQACRALYGV